MQIDHVGQWTSKIYYDSFNLFLTKWNKIFCVNSISNFQFLTLLCENHVSYFEIVASVLLSVLGWSTVVEEAVLN